MASDCFTSFEDLFRQVHPELAQEKVALSGNEPDDEDAPTLDSSGSAKIGTLDELVQEYPEYFQVYVGPNLSLAYDFHLQQTDDTGKSNKPGPSKRANTSQLARGIQFNHPRKTLNYTLGGGRNTDCDRRFAALVEGLEASGFSRANQTAYDCWGSNQYMRNVGCHQREEWTKVNEKGITETLTMCEGDNMCWVYCRAVMSQNTNDLLATDIGNISIMPHGYIQGALCLVDAAQRSKASGTEKSVYEAGRSIDVGRVLGIVQKLQQAREQEEWDAEQMEG